MILRSIFVIFLILSLFACSDDEPATARLVVKLTDAPADYQEVNIDIQDIQVNPTEDDEGWISLEGIQAGVYNLLELTNGLDTVLADAQIPAGTLAQIRLVLGDNNSLLMNDQIIPMSTPSGQQSGLKLNIHATLEPGITYEILMDFDAARSVVKAGNSENYNLKPVIRVIADPLDGAIKGLVAPVESNAVIYAIQGSDTTGSTYIDDTGGFLIGGLDPGDYNVHIEPVAGFDPQQINDVVVQLGVVTDVGEISLVP